MTRQRNSVPGLAAPLLRGIARVFRFAFLSVLAACGGGGGGGSVPDPDAGIAPDLNLENPLAVELTPNFELRFSSDLLLPLTNGNLLSLFQGTLQVPSALTATARVLAMRPELPLLPETDYEVVLAPGLAFVEGRVLARTYRWKLKTRATNPEDPPRVVRSEPGAKAAVGPRARFSLTFDKPLGAGSITGTSAGLLSAGGQPVGATTALTQDKLTIEIKTPTELPPGGYRLFATKAVQSTLGTPLREDVDIAFTIRDGFYALGSDPGNATTTGPGLRVVTVNFNRDVESTSFASGFKLTHGNVSVAGFPFVSGKTGSYTLQSPLVDAGEYTIRVQGVRDTAQNTIESEFVSSFRIDLGSTSWSSPKELALDGFAYPSTETTRLASSPNGRAVLAWLERDRNGPQNNLLASIFDGTSWSSPVALESSLQSVQKPRVAINDAGVVAATWAQIDTTQNKLFWYARCYRAGAWQVAQPLTDFAQVEVTHVGPTGDVGILGIGTSGVRAVEQVQGTWRASYVLQGSTYSIIQETGEEVWSTDDAGRRMVVFQARPASTNAIYTALFTDGQGWSLQKLNDGGFYDVDLFHVTPSGDALVIWTGTVGTTYGTFLQCRRSGAWLSAPVSLGQPRNDTRYLVGSSGNAMILTTKIDENRTRAFVRHFAFSSATLDAGRFLDDSAVTSTSILNLVGSPDQAAEAYYYRSRTAGSLYASNTWNATAGTWSPHAEFTGDAHDSAVAAWDRAGNGVFIDYQTALRYRQGIGFVDERTDPIRSQVYFPSRFGWVHAVKVRQEYSGGEYYSYLELSRYK